jgi:hypothetical protein
MPRSGLSSLGAATESLQAFMKREECIVAKRFDPLLELPPKNHRYINEKRRRFLSDNRFEPPKSSKPHPQRAVLKKQGRLTPQWEEVLRRAPRDKILGTSAGIAPPDRPRGVKRKREDEEKTAVGHTKLPSSSHRQRQDCAQLETFKAVLAAMLKPLTRDLTKRATKPEANCRLHDQEQDFVSRTAVKIPLDDHVKGLLVDDWENITKNNQLVPLPHENPVSKILSDYLDHERPRRGEGTAARDILEEIVAGLREYFDKALGRILLYR